MADLLAELCVLQSATDINGKTPRAASNKKSKSKAPAPAIGQSLDALLSHLHELKQKVAAGAVSGDASGNNSGVTDEDFSLLAKVVEEKRKDVEERQKEVYSSLGRMGKLLDKV
jgi:hypothetical protein